MYEMEPKKMEIVWHCMRQMYYRALKLSDDVTVQYVMNCCSMCVCECLLEVQGKTAEKWTKKSLFPVTIACGKKRRVSSFEQVGDEDCRDRREDEMMSIGSSNGAQND